MDITNTASLPGLYIHIPFCASKCPYCSFYSITQTDEIDEYLEAVSLEMSMRAAEDDGRFDSIYIGGGTPSLLSPEHIEKLLSCIRKTFFISSSAEITMEANPSDINHDYLDSAKNAGINRLNIGVQSFNDDILRWMGRRHTSEQAVAAIKASEKAGFGNIGIDLMYALPGQDMLTWKKSLQTAIDFNLHHLSCYQLNIASETIMESWLKNGDISMPDEETQRDFFLETSDFLAHAGYVHYEVSNFAHDESLMSRHNCKYWDHTRYTGIGAAAHSFNGSSRFWNHSSVDLYISNIRAGIRPVAASEVLSADQLRLEKLFLSLRTRRGLDMKDFENRYSGGHWESRREILEKLEKEGIIEINDGFLKPTTMGLALADSLAVLL